ncbi:MAG: Bax inhibitor-1/YccA family protein [Saprospiraceae bacterium]|nr:Bax inhibitor-1/YccA family protein [Bacteroidia bacterium]NNE15414.1 Bax inhibitor-1/YccA family protein [Saprospiraceae bacterium]NNL92270.1 Bax inhibitor-1/YccA family protein [Saprospiraceae bacterium]
MLKNRSFAKVDALEKRTGGPFIAGENQMTVNGAVNRTFILVGITLITFLFSYAFPNPLFMWVGVLGGAGVFMLTSFKPHLAPITAPIYAILEGLFIGTISFYYASLFDGIIFQAGSLTIATLLTMLLVYKSGLIKVTKSFRTGVSMAVGAIMMVYIVQLIGNWVGFNVPYVFDGGPISIGITVVILGVAALNLLLDFDNFDKGEQMGAPKYMEWFYGMALLFTIVWLYVEFLRLLSYLRD